NETHRKSCANIKDFRRYSVPYARHRELLAVFLRDGKSLHVLRESLAMKFLIGCFYLLLVISPIDLIPDVVPIVGWLDDIAYVSAAYTAFSQAFGGESGERLLEEKHDE